MQTVKACSGRMLVGLALLSTTGCGGSDAGSEGAASGDVVELSAADNVFTPMELEVPEGKVTVKFVNEGTVAHTFTIEDITIDSGSVEPGTSKTVTFRAPKERTEFICKIHYESNDMGGHISPG